jgi:hypothetical protein
MANRVAQRPDLSIPEPNKIMTKTLPTSEGGQWLPVRAFPARTVTSFCIKEIVEQAIGDIEVIGKREYLLTIDIASLRRGHWIHYSAKQHRRLNRGREQAGPGDRITA